MSQRRPFVGTEVEKRNEEWRGVAGASTPDKRRLRYLAQRAHTEKLLAKFSREKRAQNRTGHWESHLGKASSLKRELRDL